MTLRNLLLLAAGLSAISAGAALAQSSDEVDNPVSEVIVRGTPLRHSVDETATPVAKLSGEDLVHRRQATLGETLQSLPGVNADTFGGGAARPVVRGQTAPRVKVLVDSSELMDASAVSPDHAITTEPLLLREIEVFRGPSALIFGGGAISGAVNLIDGKIPTEAQADGVEGVAELRAGTNGRERAGVLGVTIGGEGFALHAEAVRRTSDDYEVSGWGEDKVHGTYNNTSTIAFGGSWIGERGYLGAAYTLQNSRYGLPGHAHEYADCHPHGSSLHCGGHGHDEDDHDHDHDHEGEEAAPFVSLKSQRWDVRGELREPMAGIDRVRLRAGFTDYRHQEIEGAAVGTTFANDGHDLRLEVEHAPLAGWRGVIGLQTADSDFSALGDEAFLPASRTRNTGLYVFEERIWGDWHFELAARKEWQKIKGDAIAATDHGPASASASALWNFTPGYSAALAVSRSQRAPTAQELYARGVHLATNTFEIGDAGLDVETAQTVDLTFRKTTGRVTFTLGAFRHRIADYIFADTLDQFEDFRLIRYAAADADFTGLDGEVTHRFNAALSATLFGDYVRAELTDGGDLPRIPAARLGVRVEGKRGPFGGEIEYYRAFEQDRVAAFEAATPGYDMVNATVSYAVKPGLEVYARGNNLLDELAFNHTSFISRQAPLRGRAVVMGIRAEF